MTQLHSQYPGWAQRDDCLRSQDWIFHFNSQQNSRIPKRSISWSFLTKRALKKDHVRDQSYSGNGTLRETVGGETRPALACHKDNSRMAILRIPGA